MGWFSRRKKAATSSPTDLAPPAAENDEPKTWTSHDERDQVLRVFDSLDADGDLDPLEAAQLAEQLAPLVDEEFAKGPLEYDKRVYISYTAATERAGRVRGKHFTEWVDVVRQLKRDGHREEALRLLIECIDAAERDHQGREPAPWYTEQAAIILRQMKDYDAEVAILQRWVAACPPERRSEENSVEQRLAKAVTLRAKKLGT